MRGKLTIILLIVFLQARYTLKNPQEPFNRLNNPVKSESAIVCLNHPCHFWTKTATRLVILLICVNVS